MTYFTYLDTEIQKIRYYLGRDKTRAMSLAEALNTALAQLSATGTVTIEVDGSKHPIYVQHWTNGRAAKE